jgi:hypothetical protein
LPMTAGRSLALGVLVLISALLLVGVWLNFVRLGPISADGVTAFESYQRAEVPVSLGLVLLMQFLFAWVARAPKGAMASTVSNRFSEDAWKRVWIRLFVSFCWTLTLAILLFVVLVLVSDV